MLRKIDMSLKKQQYSLINHLRMYLKYNRFYRKWRALNEDNNTYPVNNFAFEAVSVGKSSYGELCVVAFNNKSKVCIGNYVSIAQEVVFILDADHCTNTITTYPHKVKTLRLQLFEASSKGDIIVQDDVWIGYGSTILSGVTIGQGAVIAAGSVVSRDVPPYAIVGGVPAKVIKYRFEEPIREKLLKIDFSKLDEDMIREHIDELYQEVTENTDLSWLPMKEE